MSPYNFVGKWTGQLEYRDLKSNAQVFLSTWLTITETANLTTITLDPVAAKITFTSDRDKTTDIYALQGLDEFSKLGRGTPHPHRSWQKKTTSP